MENLLVYRSSWRTREVTENALLAYIDGWYDTERIQARLGWLPPDEYEAAWHTVDRRAPWWPRDRWRCCRRW